MTADSDSPQDLREQLTHRLQKAVNERIGVEDPAQASKLSLGMQLRRLESLYHSILAGEVKRGIQAVTRSNGPHPDYIWQAAAQWSLVESAEAHQYLVPYLKVWGYDVIDADNWLHLTMIGPTLSMKVEVSREWPGHAEHCGHTWYMIDCCMKGKFDKHSIADEGNGNPQQIIMLDAEQDCEVYSWRAPRRLAQLRDCLHDRVKEVLGDDYPKYFGDTPFARYMGPPGTTDRLAKWLDRLAEVVNKGVFRPSLVAKILAFLRGPAVSKSDTEGLSNSGSPGHSEPAPGDQGLDALGPVEYCEDSPGTHSGGVDHSADTPWPNEDAGALKLRSRSKSSAASDDPEEHLPTISEAEPMVEVPPEPAFVDDTAPYDPAAFGEPDFGNGNGNGDDGFGADAFDLDNMAADLDDSAANYHQFRVHGGGAAGEKPMAPETSGALDVEWGTTNLRQC
mmetsp:Transcript_70563/g.147793  ORF Transcript_70563/g.147793 Transcript_70563/m.147793 type:complete len:450 (-) Transcript_70563:156-1505(-)|eukprot:CAMPEP_0206421044 /NCGR_PEP_ID=MMETSP0324_2-20121206/1225_1 /ASSEMBLY_ACC=CAM_ASM_000836 /TAXON_ID=2866 /ORGANISM="Crypthecodinium cohnii, Strain Seligo" /LENGTH=449 /DNA_ID=CAMNT_0053885087 /DNA_START=156 /DNA_END=1505 /DNA_ORIENTATION=-